MAGKLPKETGKPAKVNGPGEKSPTTAKVFGKGATPTPISRGADRSAKAKGVQAKPKFGKR